MATGVVDPMTSKVFTVHIRKHRAEGFSACPDCEMIKSSVRMSKDPDMKKGFVKMYKTHLQNQKENRDGLARVKRLCRTSPTDVGVFIDAVDKNKFGVPTTESNSKDLAGQQRVKQKLTGVQFFSDGKLILFLTTRGAACWPQEWRHWP